MPNILWWNIQPLSGAVVILFGTSSPHTTMPIRCLRVGLPRFGSVWSHPSLTGLSLLSRHPCKTRPVRPTIFVPPKCPVSRVSSNQVRLPLPVPFYRFGTCPAKNTKAPNLLRRPKSFWRDRFEATSTLLQILRLPFNVSGFSDVNGFSGYSTVSRRKFQSEECPLVWLLLQGLVARAW